MNATQNWTDENVVKLVKQKQIEELEKILILNDLDFENNTWIKVSNYCIERLKELK